MKKKYLGLMALVLPLWAVAQEPVVKTQQEPYEWNAANGEKLQALKAKGDPVVGAITFQICESCHRADASGRVSGAYPRLAGQHPSVLIKQMTDIRAGRRDNPKMEPFITDHVVTPQEIADIASYVSAMPIPPGNGKGPGLELARGKKLYAADCATCHGEKGEGSDAKFYPMVAAQHFKYLLREGKYIKDGTRRNANPKMKKIIAQYTDEDIEAVSDYMSQLPPPR